MLTFLLFIFGLFMGSFFGVVVSRLHSGEKGIFTGRSHCDHCNYTLTAMDLVPVFSWVFLGGKCRKCRKKISWEHPLLELLTGLVWASVGFFVPMGTSPALIAWTLFVVTVLWVIAVYDFKFMEIPDQISLPTIVVLLFISLGATFCSSALPIPHLANALAGAAIPLGFFGLQIALSYVLKRDLVGGGDLRLGALMGIVLGWQITILALFLAYIIGALFAPLIIYAQKKHWKSEVPFGPFLALATYIALFWGTTLLHKWLEWTGVCEVYGC